MGPIRAPFKNGFYAGLLGAFILGLWLTKLWSAENQVRLHSEHLIHAIEKRDWAGVEIFLASDYHDAWGDDRAQLLQRLRRVAPYLFSLTIASWTARIQLDAHGEAAAEISRINSLTTPFELSWRKQSWKPWDWKLAQARNPGLEIPNGDL
jgi:hypothetical protein